MSVEPIAHKQLRSILRKTPILGLICPILVLQDQIAVVSYCRITLYGDAHE